MKPLAIDLFCGLGGWTEGLLAEGYEVVGFDLERHRYPARVASEGDGTKARISGVDFGASSIGKETKLRSFNYANEVAHREMPLTGEWTEYPAQLVLQDVRTLHGSQFKDAALIVASPPCQAYSYRAMPWARAKALPPPDNELFDACFRIQREACEAAGRHIPMIVENVRGAQKWVGRARWNFGSFYLWGDVPALMPMTKCRTMKGGDWGRGNSSPAANPSRYFANPVEHFKTEAHPNIRDGHAHTKHLTNIGEHGYKQPGIGGLRENGKGDRWFQDGAARHGSKSSARKAASAHIAKIPFALAQYIARTFYPREIA